MTLPSGDDALPAHSYGPDRAGYVEVIAPPGIAPRGSWYVMLMAQPCSGCDANLFFHWRPQYGSTDMDSAANWFIEVAHDASCAEQTWREGTGDPDVDRPVPPLSPGS